MKNHKIKEPKPVKNGQNVLKNGNIFANPFANLAAFSQMQGLPAVGVSGAMASFISGWPSKILQDMNYCKLFLDTRRKKNDGTYPVRLKVGGSSKLWLSTGISVKPEHWDEQEECIIGKNARNPNMQLASFSGMIQARMVVLMESGQWESLSDQQRKELLTDPQSYEEKQAKIAAASSLGAMFEKVIASKRAPRTKEIYESTFKKIRDYCDPYSVSFDDITKMWVKEFESSLSGMAPNSIGIHLRNLRNVVNCAIDEGISEKYAFRRYDIPKQETRKRCLDIEKFRRILRVPNLNQTQQEYRDMFLLIFLLMGINLVDLAALTKGNIRNGRLEYRRSKTGRLYSIKIEPEAEAILERYKGKDHLLSFADRYANHKDYGKRMNEALRKIGEWKPRPMKERHRGMSKMMMVPIEPDISSYWARHTWGTYAAEIDIPFDTISEALGHEHSGSETTLIYVKFKSEKIDAANRRVIDYLLHQE